MLGNRLDGHDWEKISNVNVSWGGAEATAAYGRPGSRGRRSALGGQASSLWPLDLPRSLWSGACPAVWGGLTGLPCWGDVALLKWEGVKVQALRLEPNPTLGCASPGDLDEDPTYPGC